MSALKTGDVIALLKSGSLMGLIKVVPQVYFDDLSLFSLLAKIRTFLYHRKVLRTDL